MGFVQSIFGSNTGAGFQAGGVNGGDLANAANQVQNSQATQNNLLTALQGQNGIGNQSQVYGQQQNLLNALQGQNAAGNQQGAVAGLQGTAGQQQALSNQLAGANGVGTQQGAIQGLQGVAGQYQNLANGVGPNPAQAQLAQNTAANVAQTGALMAGQRGAASNVGLLARQAAQQGAATQQGAVGQAATLQAQQQLSGLQGLQGAQQSIGQMGQGLTGQQQQQQQALGSTQAGIGSLTGQQLATLQNQQTNAANLATQQVGQGLTAAQQAANTALGNQSNIYGLQSNINTTNAGLAAGNQKAQAGLIGGVLGSVGAGSAQATGAQGGEVRKMASGGSIAPPQVNMPNAYAAPPPQQVNGPQSSFGQFLASQAQQRQGALNQDAGTSGGQMGQGIMQLAKAAYQGGKSLYNYLPIHSASGGSQSGDMSLGAKGVDPTGGPNLGVTGIDSVKTGPSLGADTSLPSSAGTAPEATTGIAGADAAADAAASDAAAAGATDLAAGDTAALLAATGGQIQPGYSDTGADPSTVSGTLEGIMQYLSAKGGEIKKDYRGGGKVQAASPKQKAVKPGNDYANDKIPAVLSEHEIVLPRTVTMSRDPISASAKFVAATLAKRGKRK